MVKWGYQNQTGPPKLKLLTTHARLTKFPEKANMKKVSLKRGPPKFKFLNLLSWTHEMVVHKFSASPFEAACFKMLLHSCNITFFRKVFLHSAGLAVNELRKQLRGEYLEALNVHVPQ